MSDDELNKAIDTAARHSTEYYGNEQRSKMMLAQLKELLAIQLKRAQDNTDGKDETKP